MSDSLIRRAVVDKTRLPDAFLTHHISPAFWEQLGRVVGTFSALEEVLGKAIFALTSTRPYNGADAQLALSDWHKSLAAALNDPLGRLIRSFGRAVGEHPGSTVTNLDNLLADLRDASKLRNALCHGSWQLPDVQGRSQPLFVDSYLRVFDTAVDVPFLMQTQQHVAELSCEVISIVTHMGIQFPGTDSRGTPAW